jgi:hypothetical protein
MRQRVIPSSESTDSLMEPLAQRPNLISLLDIKVEATEAIVVAQRALQTQVNIDNLEWLQVFLRPKPFVQRAERESFDFYF